LRHHQPERKLGPWLILPGGAKYLVEGFGVQGSKLLLLVWSLYVARDVVLLCQRGHENITSNEFGVKQSLAVVQNPYEYIGVTFHYLLIAQELHLRMLRQATSC